MNEQQANQLFEEAIGALQQGKAAQAERALKKLDNAIPSNPGIIYYLGVAASLQERKEQAISLYDRVIRLHPQFVEAYNNKGLDLNHLGKHQEAIESFRKAIQIRPDFVEAYLNFGSALNDSQLYEEALTQFAAAVNLRPNYSDALTSMGGTLVELTRYQDARGVLQQAIEVNPADAKAYQNLGRLLSEQKQYSEAIAAYKKALDLNPELDWTTGDLLHAQMKSCDWADFDKITQKIFNLLAQNKKITPPLPLLSISDSLTQQKQAAEIYTNSKFHAPQHSKRLVHRREKIRVGYISGDYTNHPVTFLMSGVVEGHDRERFNIFGFDIGNHQSSDARNRIVSAFDAHYDLKSMTTMQAIDLIRNMEIDVLVDLAGHTKGARTQILAGRPSPVQVNYLGFPGTMGAQYIDYIIGDQTLIPKECQEGYTEKIAYLPDCFQANDSHRPIAPPQTRAHFGLDENAFVYGCFNQSIKFTPIVVMTWLSILRKVPHSVLWLVEESDFQKKNLCAFAEEHGVPAHRLIFTGKLPYVEHLARYSLMDLALDTMPFNGGTTTSDALWGGAPVLTCLGETFAARMAASLLDASGLPELITRSLIEYEALAIELGTNPKKLSKIRKKLADNRYTSTLFNTQSTTKHLENAYEQMVQRADQGLAPDHIYVPHS